MNLGDLSAYVGIPSKKETFFDGDTRNTYPKATQEKKTEI